MRTQAGDLMTIADLAKLTGLAIHTIRAGGGGTRDLPFLKLGGAIRYRRQDVEHWLESKTHEPAKERIDRHRLLRRRA